MVPTAPRNERVDGLEMSQAFDDVHGYFRLRAPFLYTEGPTMCTTRFRKLDTPLFQTSE